MANEDLRAGDWIVFEGKLDPDDSPHARGCVFVVSADNTPQQGARWTGLIAKSSCSALACSSPYFAPPPGYSDWLTRTGWAISRAASVRVVWRRRG